MKMQELFKNKLKFQWP